MLIRFAYFYLHGRLVVLDLTEDRTHGYTRYVASLSQDPKICISAGRPEVAIARLKEQLERVALPALAAS